MIKTYYDHPWYGTCERTYEVPPTDKNIKEVLKEKLKENLVESRYILLDLGKHCSTDAALADKIFNLMIERFTDDEIKVILSKARESDGYSGYDNIEEQGLYWKDAALTTT